MNSMPNAPRPLRQAVRPTVLIEAPRLCRKLGIDIVLASETFQHTGSFKFRAAYNVATRVSNPRIIAASSGNFGQALARACALVGKNCTIVMPRSSASVKIDSVRENGGVVDLIDTENKSRQERVMELAKEDPEAFIASAYDDPIVIEGNSTLGEELGQCQRKIDLLVTPLGGGGLASGLIQGLRNVHSNIEVVAAEPSLANDGARSWRAGYLIANENEPATIADGAKTVSLGKHNWNILKEGLGGIVEVSDSQTQQALQMLFLLANLKAEPTGALGLAALLANPDLFRGRSVCCVVSGGNVDPEQFCRLLLG